MSDRFEAIRAAARQFSQSEPIPAALLSVGLPGGPAELDCYEAIAVADEAIVAATGRAGLGTMLAARQLGARFFIAGFCSDGQKQRWLPRIAAGTCWPAIAISEPKVGAHPKHLTTSATREGESWVVSGHKMFITNGMQADLYLVLAVCGTVNGRKQYGLFAVPRDTPGCQATAMPGLDVLAPATHAEIRFENCRVPASNRIGGEEDAYPRMALPFRDVEDGVAASGLCGLTGWLLRRMAGHCEPDDATLLMTGRLAGLLELARTGAASAARLLDGGGNPVALGIGLRALCGELIRDLRARVPEPALQADASLREALAAFDLLSGVARKAREARVASLGASFVADAVGSRAAQKS